MKKSLFTIAFILLSAISAHAYDFSAVCSTGQRLFYKYIGGNTGTTVTVAPNEGTSYSNPVGDIDIPETVAWANRTYTVVSISTKAFDGCSEVTNVTIPNSVVTIGDKSFCNCSSLINVDIPNSVISIGDSAFCNCSSLTSITIPNSVTSIGKYAFYRCSSLSNVIISNSVTIIEDCTFAFCTGLASVYLPNSVTSLGGAAFYACSALTSVYYSGSIDEWCHIDFGSWNLHSVNSNPLYYAHNLYINGSLVRDVVIPAGITEIKDYTFSGGSCITSVTFPESVTSIGHFAFENCSGLTSLSIPENITKIGESAFQGCIGLTGELNIPFNVDSIGDWAFRDCENLTTVNYNATNCTYMGRYGCTVFEGCALLTTLNIGATVQAIPNVAFYGCTGLTSVAIPSSLSSIGVSSFYGCNGLTNITIPNSVTSIGNSAFSHCLGLINVSFNTSNCIGVGIFKGCSALTNLTVGDSVQRIPEQAFYDCSGIATLIIPNSVLSIGNSAFYGCSSLSLLVLGNNVSTIGDNAFDGCSVLLEIHSKNPVPPTLGNNVFNSVAPAIPVYIPCGRTVLYSYNWPYFSNFMESPASSVTAVSADDLMGTAMVTTAPTCTNPVAVVEAYPNSGYQFDHWSDGATDNPYSFNVSEDMNITAYFSSIGSQPTTYYTITAVSSNPSMGSVTGGGTYADGSTVTLTATPNNGYSFLRWREDNNTDNPRTITVTGDRTYTAIFQYTGGSQPQQYLVTVNSIDETMGTVTGGGLFDEGTVTTIMATAKPGYLFVQWQDGNTQRIRTITVTGDATYTAYFDYSNGIDDVGAADDVKIYTRGNTIVIDFSGQHAADSRQSVVVYDVMGRVIKHAAGGGQRAMVEIPVPGAGVYMVKIGDMKPQKVVVRR